jgi:hypothetical protein
MIRHSASTVNRSSHPPGCAPFLVFPGGLSDECCTCWVTNHDQWRNVISGGPRFKIFEGPPSRSANYKGTSWAQYMHKFTRGSRACSSRKFLNLHSLKCHFLDFGERFYRILMVRKWHCNISEVLANVFALSPKPGRPHLAHWGWGTPGSPGLSP